MNACRESGGAINDVLTTPGRCKFDPKVIMCPSGDGANCLTAGQTKSLTKILHGPVNSAGVQLHPGFVPGHEEDYAAFITGTGTDAGKPSSSWTLADIFMRQFVFGLAVRCHQEIQLRHRPRRSHAVGLPLRTMPIRIFPHSRAHGGKLIMYHGWADHSITPLRTLGLLRRRARYDGQRSRGRVRTRCLCSGQLHARLHGARNASLRGRTGAKCLRSREPGPARRKWTPSTTS